MKKILPPIIILLVVVSVFLSIRSIKTASFSSNNNPEKIALQPISDAQASINPTSTSVPAEAASPAPHIIYRGPNADETCANNLLFTTAPPKCLSTKGRLMFANGNSGQIIAIPQPKK